MKTLTWDIETSPMLVDAWKLWDNNTGLTQVHDWTRMICFAAKWADSDKVLFFSERQHGHERMVRKLYELVDEADVIVTYNGDRFDVSHANREFALLGLTPPSPVFSVDLLKVVKKQFKFASNKLAHITEQFGLSGKMDNSGHQLWRDCLYGDEPVKRAAWREMKKYAMQDVVTTEELFHRIKPWIPRLPNPSLFDGETGYDRCPACGGSELEARGKVTTGLAVFQQYKCKDPACGRWSRSGKAVGRVDLRA